MKAIKEKFTNNLIYKLLIVLMVVLQIVQMFLNYNQSQFNANQAAFNRIIIEDLKNLKLNQDRIIESKELVNYKFNIPQPSLKTKRDPAEINSDSNLSSNLTYVTEQDMDEIINYWDRYVKGGTPFKGKGRIFIEASKESGLDPVYILAHAAWESGWGKSTIAEEKHNYFGIAAFDRDPYGYAYHMGDSLDSGIIKGAKWIKENYYDRGYTNLHTMIEMGNYASDNINWINGIVSIMKTSYSII